MLRTTQSILVRAKSICANQLEMPQSPGTINKQGQISLCAAAAVAAAGLEVQKGFEARREFESKVVKSHSIDVIIDVFDQLGWEREVCEAAIMLNDTTPSAIRRERVISYLGEISEVISLQ